ncbi:MAG TPA: beta-propeller domain-containing protein [Solirubrobacteraceae bacterium]|jgi:uncharacterized secreted protein with C-terminal beta-propeller domain|nr:beta-propeller domain-containing protein [Solirubrobacteraceae bacterium]
MTASAPRTPSARKPALALGSALLAGLLPAPAVASASPARPVALPAFPSCASLLGYARRNARRTGGRPGVQMRAGVAQAQVLDGPFANDVNPAGPVPAVAAAPSASVADGKAAAATPDFSTTNDQEAGVDEPDIVKTNGRTVFAIADGELQAVDVTADKPKLVGTLALDGAYGQQLLLRGTRLLVLSNSYGGGPIAGGLIAPGAPAIAASQLVLSEIDVSNPAAMTVRRTMTMPGALVDARLTGGTARVVVGASPDYVHPVAIPQAPLTDFVPRTVLHSNVSGKTFKRSVVPCDDVRHPRDFSGLDLLTVLTIDLDKGLFNVDRDAIMAGAQTVYASQTGLYVASRRYQGLAVEQGRTAPASTRTEIARFDTSKPGRTTYNASGSVAGFVLNQYAMSEYDGALRVASTDEPAWFDGPATGDSQSYVTVLAQHGTRLDRVGRVGGLGHGERIFAVRFVGDKGYVVTFRQVDPLYTLDLSTKSAPRVVGRLDLQGYSAYLHPISDSLLLGVGQDADAQGRTQGAQLSLFDVSDPRKPVRTAQATLGPYSNSQAEFDPHAFLYWNPARLAVIPLSQYGSGGQSFEGAVGFRIGSASIAAAGQITHPAPGGVTDYKPPIGRSLVIGDKLYTLSYVGLAANALDTLAPLSFTAFPQPPASSEPPVGIAVPSQPAVPRSG